MDDATLTRMFEGLCHLGREQQGTRPVERALVMDHVAEIRPLDELKNNEVPAGIGAHRMDPPDVLMIEPGSELRLVLEATQHVDIGRMLAGEHLHRNDTIEGRVDGPEHRPHPPATDELFEEIGAEGVPLKRPSDLLHRQDHHRRRRTSRRDRGAVGFKTRS